MRRFHHRGHRPPIQVLSRVNNAASFGAVGPTQLSLLIDSRVSEAGGVPSIARMTIRGIIFNHAWTVNSVQDKQPFALGITIVTTGGGALVLPDPLTETDGDAPWMWRRTFLCSTPNSASGASMPQSDFSVPDGGLVRIKTRRVLRPNEIMVLVGSNALATGAVSGFWNARIFISRIA